MDIVDRRILETVSNELLVAHNVKLSKQGWVWNVIGAALILFAACVMWATAEPPPLTAAERNNVMIDMQMQPGVMALNPF